MALTEHMVEYSLQNKVVIARSLSKACGAVPSCTHTFISTRHYLPGFPFELCSPASPSVHQFEGYSKGIRVGVAVHCVRNQQIQSSTTITSSFSTHRAFKILQAPSIVRISFLFWFASFRLTKGRRCYSQFVTPLEKQNVSTFVR